MQVNSQLVNMLVLTLPHYLGLLFALVGFVILHIEVPKLHDKLSTLMESKQGIKVWTVSKDQNRLSLERNVFDFLEFEEVIASNNWDILWSVEYPFHRHKEQIKSLKPHQRINHFPGMSQLTIKKNLATKFGSYDFIPKGFSFPSMTDDFREYIETRPDVKFVEKNWNNRGVKLVRNINEINLKTFSTAAATKEKFLQAFVERPYLIDNKMFDIGVYVLITSFDPLRVYKFDKEILLRFCSENYYPFNGGKRELNLDDEQRIIRDIDKLNPFK